MPRCRQAPSRVQGHCSAAANRERINTKNTKGTTKDTKASGGHVWKVGTAAEERTAATIIDSALHVHRQLGPGLLESVYQACMAYELTARGCIVQCEVPLPVRYGSLEFPVGFRADMLVDELILVENKVLEVLLPVHQSQLLTYLRLSGLKLGFLINWNVPLIRDGIKRFASH